MLSLTWAVEKAGPVIFLPYAAVVFGLSAYFLATKEGEE
jgi:hypothetical protein